MTYQILSKSFIQKLHSSWINQVQNKTQCINQLLCLPRVRWFPSSADLPVSSTYFPHLLGTVLLSKRTISSYLTASFPQIFSPWAFSRWTADSYNHLTLWLCVNPLRQGLHLCLKGFQKGLVSAKQKKLTPPLGVLHLANWWCVALVNWPAGGGPYVSDAMAGAPAGLARRFVFKKAHKRTST